ncbi:MAG TPA: hypothetical protein VFI02_08090 [Armatimonadota bacterium]|nr:hypothetical protein [Armatimonadota bacterium]
MTPLAVIGLIEQVLKLVNNIIEGKSLEQRQAEALIAWNIFRPLIWPFLPDEVRVEVAKLMDKP